MSAILRCRLRAAIVPLSAVLIMFFPGTLSAQTQKSSKGYGKASYVLPMKGKFMRDWLLAGPFPVSDTSAHPNDELQEAGFKADFMSQVTIQSSGPVLPASANAGSVKWKQVRSGADLVDLDSIYSRKDYAYAYALAEIMAEAPTKLILGIGSDDGVKVWLNGKEVHNHWIARGAGRDDDLVPLSLQKGSNQLLLKVQDIEGGWGFLARVLDAETMAEQMNAAIAAGNVDRLTMLIDGGADVNGADKFGIKPMVAARVSGRETVINLLKKKGAMDVAPPAAEALLDAMYAPLKIGDAPGLALLVSAKGKLLYRKAFGFADIGGKIPATPETKFRIGSVTKQFAAAAILKLQEQNLVSVDDKLSKFIPDFPRGGEVTIHHLLTHTSGIHSYTSRHDFLSRVTGTISPDSLVALIKTDPYDFNPGEQFSYNNSGYFLLGYIISKITGKSFGDYLKEAFFDPLGMKNTGIHYAGIRLANEAKGYSRNGNLYEVALDWDMSWAGAAGALYSTVDDLLKWNEALYGGKVLSEKSLQAALTPVTLSSGKTPPMKYGYGLATLSYRGQDVVGHSGGLNGFLTQLAYFPEEKLSVVIFTNTDGPQVNFDPNKVAEAFLWEKMEKQGAFAEITLTAEKLTAFAGRYAIPNVGVLFVTTEGNRIYAQLSGQGKFEIFPYAENKFFWKVVDAQLEFGKLENAVATTATIYQGGQELTGKRLEEEKIVKVDQSLLDRYAGKYKMNEMMLVVTRDGDKLIVKPDGQPKLEMWPVSDTEFVIKEINARIWFTLKDGKATGFKLNLNGTDSQVVRVE